MAADAAAGMEPTADDEQAAIKVQAAFRGHSTRTEIAKQKDSAVKLQAAFRGHSTRNEIAKQHDSAVKLQAAFRGHATRTDIETQQKSAIMIQSQFRGHRARSLKHSNDDAEEAPNNENTDPSVNLMTLESRESDSLLNTLSTTDPKHYYSMREREEFAENEAKQNAEKMKLKDQQKLQEQQQEESAVLIQRTFREHQTRQSLGDASDGSQEAKKSKTKSIIYKRVCKIRAKELMALRVSGYSKERVTETHELVEKFQADMDGAKPRWYTADEIATHNYRNDCWVVIFRRIFDITALIQQNAENRNTTLLIRPLLRFAGQDISDWFDSYTNDVKTHIDPTSNLRCAYLPYGRFIDVAPPAQVVTDWSFEVFHDDMPWWRNSKFVVGLKSETPRNLRMVNTLTSQENVLQVASEETLREIQEFRYAPINKHSGSYTWKYQSFTLDMSKTLSENGIADEEELFDELQEEYIPSIYIYFDDDLTVS